MAPRYEVELKIQSARDLKNVNWRNGALKPYAVVWIDPSNKFSTKVDAGGDTSPYWNETLDISFPSPIEDATLNINIVHVANGENDVKPLIGAARLRLSDVVDSVGFGERTDRTLQLKRPSGRPQGKVEVKVTVRESRYRSSDSYYAPPYGVPPPSYATSYSAPRDPYYATAPPSGYSSAEYNAPAPDPVPAPAAAPYGQASYGQPAYGQPAEKKNKFGMGTGLAVGAVAGVLGGLVLGEGIEHMENKRDEKEAEKAEENDYDDY
ncbi:protein SRC2 homolog isoform X3 [Cucurbita moschata]|uniref:Protein SRC2 homolog isoform X3 n=1 Tax=Cucurbita moschata TaxID=3662 RepID=A0A6J1E5G1_CUCMO|nr:protein SRC2 homolog isoform X3 [Cucurbita moschata]